MVTERVITLPTEPTEGEMVISHMLFSFINMGQRGRIHCITLSVAMLCLLQLATKCQQIIHKSRAPYVTWLFHAQTHVLATGCESCLAKFNVPPWSLSWAETVHKTPCHSWKPYLVQTNKFTGQKRVNNLVPCVYRVVWNFMQLFSDNNTLVLRTHVLLSQNSSLDSIPHGQYLELSH